MCDCLGRDKAKELGWTGLAKKDGLIPGLMMIFDDHFIFDGVYQLKIAAELCLHSQTTSILVKGALVSLQRRR